MKKIAIMLAFILSVFSGCGLKSTMGLDTPKPDPYPVSSLALGEAESKKLSERVPVHLYFYHEKEQKLALEVRHIELADAKKPTAYLAGVIIKELTQGPKQNNSLKPTIPTGTKLRKEVTIKDGVAGVDFSGEFLEASKGSKAGFEMALYSVVNSLTELKDIHKVDFKVNGQPLLKEQLLLGKKGPLERNSVLISTKTSLFDIGTSAEQEYSITEILE